MDHPNHPIPKFCRFARLCLQRLRVQRYARFPLQVCRPRRTWQRKKTVCLAQFQVQTSVKSEGHSTLKGLETVEGKWETSVKSCGQSTHKGLHTVRGKWETNVKSCGQSRIMRPKHPQRTGDSGSQIGDKCKNHAAKAPTSEWRQWGGSAKSCGQSTHKRLDTVGGKGTQVQKSCGQRTHKRDWNERQM